MFIREQWKQVSRFHDLTETEVLREVSRRVGATLSQGQAPIVLLDLDSTLYEVGPRTHQIISEWLATDEARRFPLVRRELERLEHEHVGYSLKDTFSALGIDATHDEVPLAIAALKQFWQERFFSSSYLQYDRPYPGAAEFVQQLHRMGALIVYLTGRDEPGMGQGTREMFLRDGFPWDVDRTHLLLKPAYGLPDLDHKVGAAHFIRRHGLLVASFENEPANLLAIYEQFPDAMHVFVETVSSDHAAPAGIGLYRIRGFQ
ncbi:MAG: hypothetical protein RJB38_1314 [Pseudomonadota bacterium]|jgi:hypothetical protein